MTSSYAQIYEGAPKDSPRLAMWRKAEAERRFRKRHFFALESEKHHVADLCFKWTCVVTDKTHYQLVAQDRRVTYVNPRHIAMTVAYELSGLSTIALGKLFNRTRHMILHAQRRVNTTPALREQADRVVAAVKRELKRK